MEIEALALVDLVIGEKKKELAWICAFSETERKKYTG